MGSRGSAPWGASVLWPQVLDGKGAFVPHFPALPGFPEQQGGAMPHAGEKQRGAAAAAGMPALEGLRGAQAYLHPRSLPIPAVCLVSPVLFTNTFL